ncbi:MAG: MFS transporter, partial [Caulobacteraceae bacterium]|nr:MFS transporter [Caulobacteraceae bacterium]
MADEATSCSVTEAPTRIAEAARARSIWPVLAALVAIYAFAHLDRQILSLLVEPLKRDLGLSDTGISLLQGFAFALFMAVAGLPIGRLVDRGRRTAIIAAGVLTWGVTTMGCGFASTFAELMVLRMGVGAGEAVLTPGAHSIIAEAAPKKRLGVAMGIFGIGSYIGAGLAFVVGAFILAGLSRLGPIHLAGFGTFRIWQLVFLAVGAPALPMALWALSLPEPKRPPHAEGADHSIGAAVRFFTTHYASVGLVNVTGGFTAVALYAASAWFPTFLIRTFHWTASAAGVAFGLTVMVCGAAGVVAGGLLGDFVLSRGFASGRVMVMGAMAACAAPFACAAPLMASPSACFVVLAAATLLTTMTLGLLPAAQQAIVPDHLRGSTSALGTL